MGRRKSWGQYKKSFLDTIIERLRIFQVKKYIRNNIKILDLGCGYNAYFLNSIYHRINNGIGIDLSVNKNQKTKITLISGRVDRGINLESNCFDVITSLALIEHVENPERMLKDVFRLLNNKGILFLTTPSEKSKVFLEFMAFKLGVISRNELEDHKRYYSKETLTDALVRSGFKVNKINIKTFEMGLNLFVKATK